MNSLFKKINRSIRYYYYKRKNNWVFPSNISHLSGGKMAEGSYEPEVSKILAKNLDNGDIFIDIGANVGYFSRLASKMVGKEGRVYAFEAEPENYCALSQNMKYHSNINTLHFALSGNNSFINVNHSSHSACHSIVNTGNLLDGLQFSAPAITLDHFWKIYLQKKTIHLLKIDVEGAEFMVLKGMKNILSENKVNSMIIEFCPAITKNAGFDAEDLYEKIATNFSISIIDTQYRSIVKDGTLNSKRDFKAISNHLLSQKGAVNINLLCRKM